ncbi:MAG: hypothetical protein ACOC8N_01320, partial [Spirochaetota bacterium]
LGAVYWLGYLREPVVRPDYTLSFDRVHLFGLEAAAAAGRFTLRGEAAYLLTGDAAGDDPLVHNNRVEYLAGFDVNLPVSNLNLKVQNRGSVILRSGRIGPTDVEYDPEGDYTANVLAVVLSDSWSRDRVRPELQVTTTLEKGDLLVRPRVELDLLDQATLHLEAGLFAGDPGEYFGQFEGNDYLEAGLTYPF